MAKSRSPFMQTRTEGGIGPLVLSNPLFFGAGNVFFVQSTNANAGDSAGRGQTPDAPFATIDYAVGQCTANQGDMIIVLPGHVETVTAAAGIALDVAGVHIVGVGNGQLRPKINFTTAVGASFDITAANCRVTNLWLNCAIDDQTAMMNIQAAGVTVEDCDFMISDATFDGEIGILANGSADELTIQRCRFRATGNTAAAVAISCSGTDNTIIRDNIITGYFSTSSAINNTAAAVNFMVIGNFIMNRSADANNLAINLNASTVGIVANNRIAVIDSTSPAPIVAAAAFVSGNYSVGAVGVSASTLI